MTRTLGRRLIGMVVVTAAALGAAGCDGETPVVEPPSAAASVAAPPTVSPTPSGRAVAEPERPAAMDDDGPRGAEAAAIYFLELDAYMQATGDTATWESMSHQTCGFCSKRLEQARLVAANGDTFQGGAASVQIVTRYDQDPATGIWPMDVRVDEAATTITHADGTVAFEKEANAFSARVEVARRSDVWVFIELANAKPL